MTVDTENRENVQIANAQNFEFVEILRLKSEADDNVLNSDSHIQYPGQYY